MRDDVSTFFYPNDHNQGQNCQEDTGKLETFGINVCDMEENQKQKKINLNTITDAMVKSIASKVISLLETCNGKK